MSLWYDISPGFRRGSFPCPLEGDIFPAEPVIRGALIGCGEYSHCGEFCLLRGEFVVWRDNRRAGGMTDVSHSTYPLDPLLPLNPVAHLNLLATGGATAVEFGVDNHCLVSRIVGCP